jgi:hypothetical protein
LLAAIRICSLVAAKMAMVVIGLRATVSARALVAFAIAAGGIVLVIVMTAEQVAH